MVCGLADHAVFLANALRQQETDVSFIFCRWKQSTRTSIDASATAWDGSSKDLLRAVQHYQPDWLWIQLSGYGYSRWGAPYRLGIALRRLRARMPRMRLAVCLHEIHCKPAQLGFKGPILSPWQKHTVRLIARLADLVFTSNDVWRHWAIHDYGVNAGRVIMLPIGSNIPSLTMTPSQRRQLRRAFGWDENELIAVAFGSFASQIQALRTFRTFLLDGFKQGVLNRVVCMGGDSSVIPLELARLAAPLASRGGLQITGNRPAREIAELLSCCDLGLCPTPVPFLQKSGAFIACACAGLAIITNDVASCKAHPTTPFPVWSVHTWNWQLARSPIIDQVRYDLRRYALENYNWDMIARTALDTLRRHSPINVPAIL
jgi:hypothetical protein